MDPTTRILRKVVQETNKAVGQDYFRSLVRSLASGLGVAYCFVTHCLDTPPTRVRTLAFWTGEGFAEPIDYALRDTPCEAVILNGAVCTFGSDVQALFPHDQDLVELEVESYAAVPLVSSTGAVLGHLVVLGREPFGEPGPDPSLLELFAARAAAELERQEATRQLADSEARLRQVIDLVPHYIFAKDLAGKFILVNKATADAYGSPTSELIGKTDADFSATAEQIEAFRRDDLEVIRSGRPKTMEEVITDASGTQRRLLTTKIPFRFDHSELQAVLGVSTDTTELWSAERSLRAIVEGTSEAGGDGLARSLVRHLAKALGTHFAVLAEFAADQVRTVSTWAGDSFLEAATYPLADTPCEHVFETQARVFFPEKLLELFPNDALAAEWGAQSYLGVPLFDGDTVIGLLAVLDLQPMAHEVERNQLLAVFASRAATELQRMRLEVRQAKLQAQVFHVQKLESLGVLAGGIAHDFNNLLSAIVGHVDLASMKLEQRRVEGIPRHLEEVLVAAQRSAELTHQMLAYSGHGNFVISRIDLTCLVEEMSDLLSVSVSKKAQVQLELGEGLPLFEGDATQIRQVVMNLIMNASESLNEAPGAVWLRTGVCQIDPKRLTESFLEGEPGTGDYLFLEVEDEGCGMSAETLERLFDPFFTTKDTGRGLGLAALLGIVRGHHGALRVQSTEGQGSRFRVFLKPCAVEASGPHVSAPVPSSNWRGSGTILVADDEPLVRALLGELLEHLGFEVVLTQDGREALEVFRSRSVEIRAVVLDMKMPELDGVETLQAMRELDPDVKVLLCSGFSEHSLPPSFEVGAAPSFLQKPITLDRLREKLQGLVG